MHWRWVVSHDQVVLDMMCRLTCATPNLRGDNPWLRFLGFGNAWKVGHVLGESHVVPAHFVTAVPALPTRTDLHTADAARPRGLLCERIDLELNPRPVMLIHTRQVGLALDL
jgi:hypothetical protein